jgi:tetratricopeptide (TPR) repeat protein
MYKGLFLFCIGVLTLFSSCGLTSQSSVKKDIAAEYYALAEAYAGVGKYEKAEQYYRRAAERAEYRNAAMYGVGRMSALRSNWKDAVVVFSDLYDQDADNTMLATALAYALAQSGETERALDLYKGIYASNEDDPSVCRNYAQMLFVMGKYEESIALVQELEKRFAGNEIVLELQKIREAAEKAILPPPPEGPKT